jgi:hypothetical protein
MRLVFLLLLLPQIGLAGAPFLVKGDVFTALGTSGTPSTANSYAWVTLLRDHIPGESAVQNPGPNPTYPQRLFPAGKRPAFFLTDTGSQWNTALATSQTVLAVVETIPGRNGWSGDAYAAAVTKAAGQENLVNSRLEMPRAFLKVIPCPAFKSATEERIEILIPGFEDSSDRVTGLALYRRLKGEGNSWVHLGNLPNPQVGTPSEYVDHSVTAAAQYEYAVAVNYAWPGGGGLNDGNLAKETYTTAGRAVGGPFAAARIQPETAKSPVSDETPEMDVKGLSGSWAVFPNPATGDKLEFVFESLENSSYLLRIHNLLGEKVKLARGTVKKGVFRESCGIGGLSNGVYLIRLELTNDQGRSTILSWKKIAIVK